MSPEPRSDPRTEEPAAGASLPRPERALRALEALSRRVRKLFLVEGLVVLGLTVSGVLVVTFLLDYLLNLPRPVRLIEGVAAVALLGAVL